ncbi:predicted protein [Nematostella vectensis]|uniref:Uncharacterized protein n=1 Tax=Nematostella vectensis TaxID=45351 RepID=A7RZU0_NEMVE|nr:predicted protein [Nematostella vectensis]|eukprot:XP_001635112.1 predicted protein [Nematostella vectensis]
MNDSHDPRTDSKPCRKRIQDDQVCVVCGDQSTGKHYGVFACDGCSGFFKRTSRRLEPWVCKAQNACSVKTTSRNECKACRMKKCVEVGMKFDGIKHSDFHVSTQTPLHQQATEDSNYPSGTDFDTINPSNFSSTISESSHSASPYEELSTPNRPTISYVQQVSSKNIQDAATRLLSASIRFARNVPCFTRLPFRDQIILLEEGWKELFLLDAAYWALPLEIASLLAVTGGCHGDSYRHKASEIKLLQELLARLRSFQMDLNELACLKAIVLFRPETKGLKDSDQVDKIQDHIQLLLAHHTMTKHPTHPSRFGKLLLSISPLHSLAEKPIEDVLFRKTDDKDIFESVLSQLMDNSC